MLITRGLKSANNEKQVMHGILYIQFTFCLQSYEIQFFSVCRPIFDCIHFPTSFKLNFNKNIREFFQITLFLSVKIPIIYKYDESISFGISSPILFLFSYVSLSLLNDLCYLISNSLFFHSQSNKSIEFEKKKRQNISFYYYRKKYRIFLH